MKKEDFVATEEPGAPYRCQKGFGKKSRCLHFIDTQALAGDLLMQQQNIPEAV